MTGSIQVFPFNDIDFEDHPLVPESQSPPGALPGNTTELERIFYAITGLSERLDMRIGEISENVTAHSNILQAHEQRFNTQDHRMDRMERMITQLQAPPAAPHPIVFAPYKILIECIEHICGFTDTSVIVDSEFMMKLYSYNSGKTQREAKTIVNKLLDSADGRRFNGKPEGMISEKTPYELTFNGMLDIFSVYFDHLPPNGFPYNLNMILNGKRRACKIIKLLRDMDTFPTMQTAMGTNGVKLFIEAFRARFPDRSIQPSEVPDINTLVTSIPARRQRRL